MKVISIIVAVCLGLDFLWNTIFFNSYYSFTWILRNLLFFYGPLILFFATFAAKYNNSNATENTVLTQSKEVNVNNSNEGAGGIKWLCLLFPLVGLILYLVWQSERPVAAKECGKFALIGAGISIGLGAISFITNMALFINF